MTIFSLRNCFFSAILFYFKLSVFILIICFFCWFSVNLTLLYLLVKLLKSKSRINTTVPNNSSSKKLVNIFAMSSKQTNKQKQNKALWTWVIFLRWSAAQYWRSLRILKCLEYSPFDLPQPLLLMTISQLSKVLNQWITTCMLLIFCQFFLNFHCLKHK